MDYILIGAEMHTLPYATEIKADSLEAAKAFASDFIKSSYGDWETVTDEEGNESHQRKNNLNHYRAYFLIDTKAGVIKRVFFNQQRELHLSDDNAAFVGLGDGTPEVLSHPEELDTPTES